MGGDFQQNVLVLVGPTAVVTLHLWKNRVDFTARKRVVSNCIPTLTPMAVTNGSKPQSAENIIRGTIVSPISPRMRSVETPVGHPIRVLQECSRPTSFKRQSTPKWSPFGHRRQSTTAKAKRKHCNHCDLGQQASPRLRRERLAKP